MPAMDDRAVQCRTIALRALARLAKDDSRPKPLHRLRTHLRRLQAFLEMTGEDRLAEIMADCVASLSQLRILQVFQQYLTRQGAPASDLRRVKSRIRRCRKKLRRKQAYHKIERRIRRDAVVARPASASWPVERLRRLRKEHAKALRDLLAEAAGDPRRKTLHALRLRIKAIRYQEEWAVQQGVGRPDLIKRLKNLQSLLGTYEERAEFRRLARKLQLKSRATILNDWRRSRKRARAVLSELPDILGALNEPALRLVKPAESPSPAAGPMAADGRASPP
jgi:CHAD domain-containing protein